MKGYKDLGVYQQAHKLAVEIHKMSLVLPNFEKYEEGTQIRRSSKSVPANIVEGYGRKRYQAEFIRFLVFAHASCEETIEHLELLFETGSLKDKNTFDKLLQDYNVLGGMLNKFIQGVEEKHLSG